MASAQGTGAGTGTKGRAARVFISYAHDDGVHEDRVRDLWLFLRACGIDARLDLTAAETPQDWAQWMTQQIGDADRVLVIASPQYKRRADGDAGPRASAPSSSSCGTWPGLRESTCARTGR